jgi:hypothetical protein
MGHPKFVEGDYDTTFIDKVLGRIEYKKNNYEIAAISSVVSKILSSDRARTSTEKQGRAISPWKMAGRQAMMRKR